LAESKERDDNDTFLILNNAIFDENIKIIRLMECEEELFSSLRLMDICVLIELEIKYLAGQF
jgi:hypothetical protein